MIAAVAFDMDNNPSPVYRSVHTFTRDGAGDAQEFVDYYMGSITTYSVTEEYPINQASLVVATDDNGACRELGKRVASKNSAITLRR